VSRPGGAALRVGVPVAAVLVVQLVLFPMPAGQWQRGLVLGLLGALMATGLALVYRLNRVVNFAQGDLGTAPAVLAFGLVALSGVNYFVGLATGLVGVVLCTAVIEVLVIRRFTRAPRLVLTVVTIGLSQLLVVVSLLIPRIWGEAPIGTASVSFPWQFHLWVQPLTQDDLVAAVVAVLALAGVALWSQRTDVGIAVRAAGDRRERALMLGIPVNRLQTVTWVVAGVLSFLSVFFKACILGLPLDPTFSLTALVTALAALALGGFTDLPAVAASAVALGVLEQGVAWNETSNPVLYLAVLAAVVLGAVLVRQLTAGRALRPTLVSWTLAGGARDLPRELRDLPEVRYGRPALALVLAAAVATVPLWLGPGQLIDLSTLVALAVVGASLVVLTGWSGQVSLGQMSFAAVGATVGAVALLDWHWELGLALPLAGGAAAVVAAAVGIPTLRLDGVFVAVTTLAFGLAVSGYLLDRAEFSWIPTGSVTDPRLFGLSVASETATYGLCLGVGVLVLLGLWGLRHSRTGRVLRALQTNPRAAAGYGVAVARAKLSAFALSGFIAGLAGCLLVVVDQQYTELPFTVPVSLAVFTATAVGGLGSPLGAVVGAALVEGSALFLPPSWQLFPSAVGVLVVLLAFPAGVASLLFDARDALLARVAARRTAPAPAAPSSPPGTPAVAS
jgi:branched-chain amino acid transport system permease protein